MKKLSKHVHWEKSMFSGKSACGIGVGGSRGARYAWNRVDLVDCKNCMRAPEIRELLADLVTKAISK